MAEGRAVGIAGAGVAGLALGALLANAGWRVTVFDKLERPAPIGSGLILQPVGMAVLAKLGVAGRARDLGARIDRLFGRVKPTDRVVLDVRYSALDSTSHGIGIHRGALFEILYDAAVKAGVAFETGREVRAVKDRRFLFADGSESAPFHLLIDALGVRSTLAPKTGRPLAYGALWASLDWPQGDMFDAHALEQRYVAARRMVGVLPIGRLRGDAPVQAAFFWSLKGIDLGAWRAGGVEAWKDEVRGVWPEVEPFLAQIATHDDLVYATYAHRTLSHPVTRGLVHVGDSFRCTSPQLGQGANMALLDAFALAHALTTERGIDGALDAYARMRLWHTRLYQTASWLFTPVYQSDSELLPWLRDWIAGPLSRIPPAPKVLAALVAGAIGSPLNAIGADLMDARAASMLPSADVSS
jgi:2-polyprenyl-6-methoxyphenol hydroxylase-like FAD-dependent oxidoreductase